MKEYKTISVDLLPDEIELLADSLLALLEHEIETAEPSLLQTLLFQNRIIQLRQIVDDYRSEK